MTVNPEQYPLIQSPGDGAQHIIHCIKCRWFDSDGYEKPDWEPPEYHMGYCHSWRRDTQGLGFCHHGIPK